MKIFTCSNYFEDEKVDISVCEQYVYVVINGVPVEILERLRDIKQSRFTMAEDKNFNYFHLGLVIGNVILQLNSIEKKGIKEEE